MAECMDMAQQDWDLRIEGTGLESAKGDHGYR